MEQVDRKIIDGIREGLLVHWANKMKELGNPYAFAGGAEPDHRALSIEAETIFNHLRRMKLL